MLPKCVTEPGMQDETADRVLVGQVSGLFGVKGWVKVFSYTQPRENIIQYNPWLINIEQDWQDVQVEQAKKHGKGIIAHLQGYDDLETSRLLIGCDIALYRQQLPELEAGDYYWSDLIGLRVLNLDGVDLGQVERLIETGANDVLVVQGERERLIPYLKDQVIKQINLDDKVIQVDWDPEF